MIGQYQILYVGGSGFEIRNTRVDIVWSLLNLFNIIYRVDVPTVAAD